MSMSKSDYEAVMLSVVQRLEKITTRGRLTGRDFGTIEAVVDDLNIALGVDDFNQEVDEFPAMRRYAYKNKIQKYARDYMAGRITATAFDELVKMLRREAVAKRESRYFDAAYKAAMM